MKKLLITQVEDGGFIMNDTDTDMIWVAPDIWTLQRKVEAFFKEGEAAAPAPISLPETFTFPPDEPDPPF